MSQGILPGWVRSINSDLQSCSKTRQQETSFSGIGDHSHHRLHSFLWVMCVVLCHKRERETHAEIKNGERREEKKGRKAKRDEQKNEREKWTKKKVMKETGNMLKDEKRNKKGRNKNKKWRFFLGWFFVFQSEGRKGFF